LTCIVTFYSQMFYNIVGINVIPQASASQFLHTWLLQEFLIVHIYKLLS